jgi:dynein heavy chain
LVENIDTLVVDVKVFREDFEKNGPMQADLSPGEALNRLKDFKERFSVHDRKFRSYGAGEMLFALPNQSYPALVKTQNELDKLDKLYTMYLKVTETVARWQETPWLEITEEVENMQKGIDQFLGDARRLPAESKKYPAYEELKSQLDALEIVLPLVQKLAHESVKERHWEQLIELTHKDIPFQSETFTLKDLLDADLLPVEEDVEDISDSALKQMRIEKQLREDIDSYWERAELEINPYQQYDFPCTIGGSVAEHQEVLEEHLMNLVQMLAMRQITPFRTEVQSKLDTFTQVQETLEKWLKVMNQWMSLVLVFTGGEIAKQMPQESKIFKGVDTQWKKIMERAAETKLVISCCQNDLLTSALPKMQEDLEYCQRKLETYLEKKRGVFPRFYFVSNSDLLKILSIGTDPNAIQEDFQMMFDAISRVTFDRVDRRLICAINQEFGGSTETVGLDDPVKCEGNIEDWLCKLEVSMQASMRTICQNGAVEAF